MKRRFTILTAALALLIFMAPSMVTWGQTRAEVVTYTLDGTQTGGSNGYATESEITQNDITWMVTANTDINPWRFGGKSLNGVDRPMYSTSQIAGNITKFVVTNGTTNLTVNSMTLIVSDNADFTNPTSTVTGTWAASSTTTFERPAGDDWTNKYYKLVYNLTNTSTSNKYAQFVKAELYLQEGGNPTCATPTFNPAAGTYTEAQNVSISCATSGATIYYTTNGQDPTTSSTVYSGAINVSSNTTIKAMAAKTGYDNSAVATAAYTILNIEHAGTEADPYTVADARAAIDAGTGTQNVYATGIVTEIVTAYNSQYSNISFNFCDEGTTTPVLEAYRCVGGTGIDASTVAVGDVVMVYGNLTKYNTTYEFGQGCQLVSLMHPVITEPTITVNPDVVDVDGLLHTVQLPITYNNIVVENYQSFGVQFYDAEGEETEMPNWLVVMVTGVIGGNDDEYVVTCAIPANQGEAHSTYLKVYAYDAEQNVVYSNLITISQAAPTYAELPFAFNSGKDDIESTDGFYQEGLGDDYNANNNPNTQLKFDGTGDWLLLQFNERPGTLTFDIKGNSFSGGTFTVQTSADGVTYSDLETYTSFGNNDTYEEEFDNLNENVRYIKWIYTQKVSGNVGLGNINLAKYVAPQEYTLEVTNISNAEIIVFDATNPDETQWVNLFEGIDEVQVPEGTRIALSVSAVEGYVLETLVVNNVDHVADIEGGAYIFTMPANDVTISATAVEYVPPTGVAYVLYTGELVEGDYLIVYEGGAMNTTVESDRLQFESVTATNDVIVTDNAAIVWHIAPSGQYWTIYNANAEAYAASTGAKNKAQMLSDGTDDKALWTVSGNETYEFVNKKNAANNVNANLRKNGEYGFACYATSTGGALSLYKKVALTIKGYGEDSNPGGYYLIASPSGTINPANVPGMLSDTYDLYYFDQNTDGNGNEWINYKGGSFNLEPGTGYLYAHNSTITLNFTGTPIEGPTYEVTLTKNENARFKGWNLVGNAFTKTAYVDNTHNAYYTMDADGALFVPVTSNSVDPMEGVFVVAKSDEEIITFSTTNPNEVKCSTLALNLSQGQSLLDRAIVRFDEGSQLPKLQFNRNSSKVCIPMDDEDYAVVRAEEMGEMPVNFKAESNGTYSLNFGMDNVEFAYLHLIDNLTGNEVDLLQTPSYSFEAKTTDYENRFKLVFATGDNSNEDNFAYFSNGSFVINNEGNATLQVIDITGRIVKSESVNGCANVNVNGAVGVYMLRLVNGDNVKVQKVVVK